MSPKKKHIERCGEVIATPIAERREGAGPSTGQFIQSPDVADVDEHAGRLPATRGVLATSRSIWSGTCRGEPTRLGPTPRLRLGDAKARALLREHERIVREALKAHGGSEVKTMGDGFMARSNEKSLRMYIVLAVLGADAA